MGKYSKISKRHLELKIAYLRWQISQMPHGFVRAKNGREIIYVFYDPKDPTVNRDHKRRYFASSHRGKAIIGQIMKYAELKVQLDELMKIWKMTYCSAPREICFPLIKHISDMFDHEFYMKAIPDQNPREADNPIEYNGHIFFSKNEVIVAQILEKVGYEYKPQVLIEFDRFTKFFADFIFYVPEVDKVIILEVDGALDKTDYITKSYHNTSACVINGLVEMKDFVVIRIGDPYSIDVQQIENMIYYAVDAAIDDIVEL